MFDDLLNTIEQLDNFSFEEEIKKIVYIEDEEILNLMRGQLSIGKTASGNPITWQGRDEYRRVTIETKERFGVGLGKETGWITLYMTGEFYASLRVVYNENGGYSITSDDWKYEKILANTLTDTLFLNAENAELVQQQIFAFLEQDFEKAIIK